MLINWFTVAAQVINFLILVWLLKRYLYKPILNAIDEREKRITGQLRDADLKMSEAIKEKNDFQKKNEEFDRHRTELMKKAASESETERLRLLEEARKEGMDLKLKQEKILKEDQRRIGIEIIRRMQEEVYSIARKTLSDLASLSLEESIVKVFIKRLNEQEKKRLTAAFKSLPGTIIVQSAFDLPLSQQTEIKNKVEEIIGDKAQFQFKTIPELVSGIELSTTGYKLSWSVADYLNSMEENSIKKL
jgi:F-type H+-transporting ATPase subunit b